MTKVFNWLVAAGLSLSVGAFAAHDNLSPQIDAAPKAPAAPGGEGDWESF